MHLSLRDIDRLADLHVECLPESIVSKLGRSYARQFYRYLSRSEYEIIVVERESSQIASTAVMSLEPDSLSRRLLLRTALLPFLLLSLVRLPVWKILKSQFARSSGTSSNSVADLPELILLFTAEESRGKGVAANLIRQVAETIEQKSITAFLVKTIDTPENRAISFYRQLGFKALGTKMELGMRYVLFRAETRSVLHSQK